MITIYGKVGCIYCAKAKLLAEEYKLKYEYVDIDEPEGHQELANRLASWKTVPQIFWYANHIGGFEEFSAEVQNTRNYGQDAF